MKVLRRVAALLFAVVVVTPCVVAQQQFPLLARGFQANRVYHFGDVDHVDVLSGNLVIILPLGPSYPLNGGVSHQLTLSYNSNAWEYQEVDGLMHAKPAKRWNAGMGWRVGYGHYVPNELSEVVLFDTYETPDGAGHPFRGFIDVSTSKTADGSNLRLRRISTTEVEIDFPDGRIQNFVMNEDEDDWELTQIRSSASSDTVTFELQRSLPHTDCQASVTGSTSSMLVRDSRDRTQVVCYADHTIDGTSQRMVTRVVLAGPDSKKLTYSFLYDRNVEVDKPPGDNDNDPLTWPQTHRVSLLRSLVLPDGSKYDLSYFNALLSRVTLPTLGEIAYEYGLRRLPSADACANAPEKGIPPGGIVLGVERRTLSSIAPSGQTAPPPRVWSYDGELRRLGPEADYFVLLNCNEPPNTTQKPIPFWDELAVTVTDPDGHKTVNHFNAYSPKDNQVVSPAGFSRRDFGLPYGRYDLARNRFLSQEMFECAAGECTKKRSVWVRHDFDTSVGALPGGTGTPTRLASQEVVYHDDPSPCETGCWSTVTDFTDWDGFAHYRTTTTRWPDETTGVRSKTSTTSWNTLNGQPRAIASPEPWILNTYEDVVTTEGSSVNKSQACFDLSTGFLRARRQLAGTSPASIDMIAVFEKGADDNLQREKYFGGDRTPLPSAANQTFLCSALSSVGTPEYQIDHTWQHGALATSKYLGANFLSLDQTIDLTGLVKKERDVSGLETTFSYDAQGRLTKVEPAGTASTSYTYANAEKAGTVLTRPASLFVQTGPDEPASTIKAEFQYDSFGRLWREKILLPNTGWSLRETLYDQGGRAASVSEFVKIPDGVSELGFSPEQRTAYEAYDSFGRPLRVRAPDNSLTTFAYTGVQKTTREIAGGGITPLTVATTEDYDGLGRLTRIRENSGSTGGLVTTNYGYDVGGRLTSVEMLGTEGVQNRSFEYDGRGVLRSESHPESGTTSYTYDARGHVRSKNLGTSQTYPDQRYTWDAMERMTRVEERIPGNPGNYRDLKRFEFAVSSEPGNHSLGKLIEATRYNYPRPSQDPLIPSALFDDTVTVTETYAYRDPAGRRSERRTNIHSSEHGSWPEVTQTIEYNALGFEHTSAYPTCSSCGAPAALARDLVRSYTNGYLTSLSDFVSGISYWPNGMRNVLSFTNEMTDQQTMNLSNGMARPELITSGPYNSCAAPRISNQTTEAVVTATNPSVTLSVTATGTAPLTYQWRTEQGSVIAGATGPTLTVSPSATTVYFVDVTNTCNTTRSSPIRVTRLETDTCPPPVFTAPSAAATSVTTLTYPNPLPLSVQATGLAITYTWYRQVGSGARTVIGFGPSLEFIPAATDVTADANSSAKDIVITVDVTVPCAPQPEGTVSTVVAIVRVVNATNCVATFVAKLLDFHTVIAPGEAEILEASLQRLDGATTYSFRWYRDGELEKSEDIPASTLLPEADKAISTFFHYPSEDVRLARVDAWVTCGSVQSNTVTSETYGVVLGNCPLPVVTPLQRDIFATADPVVVGVDVDWPVTRSTFQWYSGESGNTRSPLSNSNSDRLVVPNAAGTYWVRVTTDCGTHTDSPTIAVSTSVCLPVRIVVEPGDVENVAAGSEIILSVGTNPSSGVSYQWHRGSNASSILFQENGSNVRLRPIRTDDYWVSVDKGCHVAKSRFARVHVTSCAAINVIAQPADVSVPEGQTATLSVNATAAAPLRYQWYRGKSGDTTVRLDGQTGPTLTLVNPASGEYWVRLSFDDLTQCAIDSRTVVVSVCRVPRLISVPENINSEYRGQIQYPHVNVDGDRLSYQWYVGEVGDVSMSFGDDHPAVRVSPLNTTKYWVEVTSDCAPPLEDRSIRVPITVSICAEIGPPTVRDPLVVAGATTALSIETNSADRVEWFRRPFNSTLDGTKIGEVVLDGTSQVSTFVTPPITEASTFYAIAHGGFCSKVSMHQVDVAVCNGPLMQWDANNKTKVMKNEVQTLAAHLVPIGTAGEYSIYRGDTAGDVANSELLRTGSNSVEISPSSTSKYWVRGKLLDSPCYGDTTALTVEVCIPRITSEPQPVMINGGESTNLTVVSDIEGSTYQWYVGEPGTTTTPLGTASTQTVSPTADTTYWVRVTGTCGISRQSAAVTVTVCKPPAITNQPHNENLSSISTATLSVQATGTDLTYQWYEGVSGDVSKPLTSTSASMTSMVGATTDFWVRVSGRCGTVDSATAKISLPPTITTQPMGATIPAGTARTLTVAAEGTQLRYEWYIRTSGGADTKIDGATAASYTTPPLTAPTTYWVNVFSGNNATPSALATLSLCSVDSLYLTVQNPEARVNEQQTITAIPGPPQFDYTLDWYRGQPGNISASMLIARDNQMTRSIQPATTTTYWVRLTENATGCFSDSAGTTVDVCIPRITAQPQSVMVNPGASTTLTVASDLPGSTYQWYIGQPGTTTSPISGATGSSYTAQPAADTTYWVRVSGSCGRFVNSAAATVAVCQGPSITQQPSSDILFTGMSGTLRVVATGTDLTYSWFKGISGDTSTPVGSGTSSIVVTPTVTTDYWVRVTGRCGVLNSASAKLSVPPTITTQPVGGPLTCGTTRTLSVVASGTQLAYQWYRRETDGTDTVLAGATGSTFTTPVLTSDTSYWCRVFSGAAARDSDVATLTVCQPHMLSLQGWSGVSGNSVTLGVIDPVAEEVYEWYRGLNDDTSAPLGTGTTKTVSPLETTYYWMRTKRTGCDADSTAIKVSVCLPKITAQPQGGMVASGTQKTLTVAATGTPPLTYQWYIGASGSTSNPITGATSASYTTPPVTATTTYWVRVKSPQGSCGATNTDSAEATVTLCQAPAITNQPSNRSLQSTETVTVSVTATGDGLQYQWYEGLSGVTTKPVGTNSRTLSIKPGTTKSYWVRITGTCGVANSNAALLSVYPTITTQPVPPAICRLGDSATVSVTASGSPLAYQWRRRVNNGIWENVGTSPTLTIAVTQMPVVFSCTVSSGNASTFTNEVTAILNSPPLDYTTSKQVLSEGRFRLIANVAADDWPVVAYRWYQGALGNTTTLVGETAPTANRFVVQPVTTPMSYWVRAYYPDTGCSTDRAITVP